MVLQIHSPQTRIFGANSDPSTFHPALQEIIELPEFHRLGRISQTGLNQTHHIPGTPLGFNKCSRFIHSIIASGAASVLYQNHQSPRDYSKLELAAASLLHDIGHSPTSHAAEDAFPGEIDHKEEGREIILNHPQLLKIYKKYGLDAELIYALALEKDPFNPFSRPRQEGALSIDHFANIFGDLASRGLLNLSNSQQQKLLQKAYIHENGKLSYREEDIELAQLLTRMNISQNVDVIFSKRTILVDTLTIQLLRGLKSLGALTLDDFKGEEKAIFEIFHSPELPEELRTIVHQIFNVIPHLTKDQIEEVITKNSSDTNPNDSVGKVETAPTRAVLREGLYLLTPAIDGLPLSEYDPAVAKLMRTTRKTLSGIYVTDPEALARVAHDSRQLRAA